MLSFLEDIPFKIVYEDDDVLVVDKEPGMVVHPGFGNWQRNIGECSLVSFSEKWIYLRFR